MIAILKIIISLLEQLLFVTVDSFVRPFLQVSRIVLGFWLIKLLCCTSNGFVSEVFYFKKVKLLLLLLLF